MYRFRKVIERPEKAIVVEVHYRAAPTEPPHYTDEEPAPTGGVSEYSWHVVYLRTPLGQDANPVEIAEAEAELRLEADFDSEIRSYADEDFAQIESGKFARVPKRK